MANREDMNGQRHPQQEQAAQCVAIAKQRQAVEDWSAAVESLRQAMSLYAAVETTEAATADPVWLQALQRERADACQLCGDCLTAMEAEAEAVNAYQEATDTYGRVGTPAAEEQASRCAQKILAGIATLRSRPQDRLYLLIAHHERQRQQLELTPGTLPQQAACVVQMARIFQRRERPTEAIARYQEALALYGQASPTPEIELEIAECHHRIATLLAWKLNALEAALQHYRLAGNLYAAYEPPYYGVQQSRAFCERAITEIEARLERQKRSFYAPDKGPQTEAGD